MVPKTISRDPGSLLFGDLGETGFSLYSSTLTTSCSRLDAEAVGLQLSSVKLDIKNVQKCKIMTLFTKYSLVLENTVNFNKKMLFTSTCNSLPLLFLNELSF